MRIIGWAIDLFVIYWLFIATTAIVPLLVLGEGRGLAPEGNAFLRLLIVPSLLMMPLLVMSRYREMIALLLRNPFIPLLLTWAWCSVAWSVAPEISVRRALSLTTYTLLACYLALHYDVERIMRTLAWLVLALLAVSLVFILVLPGLSAMPDGRGLRGIFTHKNQMGEFLVLALIILPPAIKQQLIPKSLGWAGVVLVLVLQPLVNSATALVITVILIGIYGLLALLAYSTRVAMIVGAFGLSASLFLALGTYAYLDVLFDLADRDPTLTGRTDLWAYVWSMIQHRWIHGYGYEAFWEVEANAKYVADSLQWNVPNAHNGYLDTFLGLGLIGLTLLLAFFANAIYRVMAAFSRSSFQLAGLLLGLACAYNLRALAESNLFGQNSIMWILIVTFTVSLTPGLARIRNRDSAIGTLVQPRLDPA